MKSINILGRPVGLGCLHSQFVIDETLSFVECAICGKQLSPIWVLVKLRNKESAYRRRLAELNKIAEKANKKNRCKCQHCHNMTIIQRP